MRSLLAGTGAIALVLVALGCEMAASPDRDKIHGAAGSEGVPDASDMWQPESGTPDSGSAPESGEASIATCTNKVMDGEETAVDCGGKCPTRCDDGAACKVGDDCGSGVCKGGQCKAPGCNDQVKNGTETDLDCGGSCAAKCGALKGCVLAADCFDGVCAGGKCAAPGCTDGNLNGGETDVDCGGSECQSCADALKCKEDADCLSGFCDATAKICNPADCDNGHRDGTETDLDCGGSCNKCDDGLSCKVAADCSSAHCADDGGTLECIAATCEDGILNQDEADADCGGLTDCDRCADGRTCSVTADCLIGHQCDPAAMKCVECTVSEHCQSLTGNNIATPVCTSGLCTGTCNAGFEDCNADKSSDGCEVAVQTSTSNCGACGVACAAGFVCNAGLCLCNTDADCTNGGTCSNQSLCRCGNVTCATGEICTTANSCGK